MNITDPATAAFAATVFIAAVVEAVEALTVVLAMGLARGWRSALAGTLAALVVEAVTVALLGPALTLVPLGLLHLLVGGLLLVFGLQWLRTAILRAGGFMPERDEAALYQRQTQAAAHAGRHPWLADLDWYAVTVAFKSVLLEGFEVAFIVLSFGATQHNLPLAAVSALTGVAAVSLVGLAVHRPLARAPENAIKFAVGLMLTCFGLFWSGAGVGIHWPGGNGAVLGLFAFVAAVAGVCVFVLRQIATPESGQKVQV